MKIALKFCGGCNPFYDRRAAAEELKRLFPDMEYASPEDKDCPASLLICGCATACADSTGLPGEIITMCGPADKMGAAATIELLFECERLGLENRL
ncbi:MAG: hypothetical protein VB112_02135 [Oscillospiraceae bacterium]|nr:hypothetical protein [Oscillospiraceae bacterium]